MNTLLAFFITIAFFALVYYIVRTILSAKKKDKLNQKKFIKLSGIAFAVMIVATIFYEVEEEPKPVAQEKEVEKTPVAKVEAKKEEPKEEPKKEPELTEEQKAELAKKEEEKKVAAELKVKEAAEARVKAEENRKKGEEARKAKEAADAKAEKKKVAEPVITKSGTNKTEITKIVEDNIGKKTNVKKDRIVQIDISDLASGKQSVYLKMNASENLSNKMTTRGMWMDSIDVLEPISKIKEVDGVIIHWMFPLVDKFGNESDGLIMAFNIERETLDKINWDKFLTDNLPDVVSDYFVHPALSK